MKKVLLLAALVAAVVAPSASADRNPSYWSVAQIEDSIIQSDWADNWSIDDASCDGRGRAVKAADGTPTYRYFRCFFWTAFDGQWDQVGQVTMRHGDKWLMYLVTNGYSGSLAGPVVGP